MVTVEEADLMKMFATMLKLFDDEGVDAEGMAVILQPVYELASVNAEWLHALRAAIYGYLKFQKPGYVGNRDYAASLLRPLDEKLADRIWCRAVIEHAVHTLKGEKWTNGGRGNVAFSLRQRYTVEILEKVMSKEEAEERVNWLVAYLGL